MAIQHRPGHENNISNEVKNGAAKYVGDDIKKDINSLQSDVALLASDVKKVGSDKARDAINYVNDQVDSLRGTSVGAVAKLEEGIKSKPGQSVAIAFAAGALLSFLLGRK